MKKGKFLSILTTVAMAGSMVLSVVPFTASAYVGDVVETAGKFSMTADQTNFTLDEIKAGATAKVKVHFTGDVSGEKMLSLESKFDCSDSDWKVVPTNMTLPYPCQIANDKGSKPSSFRKDSTNTSSIWTKDFPADPDSARGNPISYALKVELEGGYQPGAYPIFKYITDETIGYIKPGEGDAVCEFDVEFPTDLAEGEYTIDFMDARCVIDLHRGGVDLADAFPETTGITFTIGDKAETTPAVTTPAVTTKATTVSTSDNRNYIDEFKLSAEKVKAEAGADDVVVAVYCDTNEYLIEALEFKMSYDKSVLELTEIEIPELCGLDPAAIDTAISTGVLSYKQVGEGQITNYAEDPIALLHFKVSADASGEIPVKIVGATRDVPVCLQKYWPAPLWEYDYLTPVVTDGAIIIDGDVTTPAETTPAVTTKATTVSTSDNRNYIDEFKLSAEKVKAEAGADDVVVAVYCDTNEYLIEALEFKMSYDKSVLELTEIEIPELCGLDPAAIDTAISTGVLSYKQVGEGQITNYAEDPIALLHFKVSADASGEIPVKIVGATRDVPVCLQKYWPAPLWEYDYLTPVVTDGAIIIDGDVTTPAETTPAETTPAVTTVSTTKATTVSTTKGSVDTNVSVSVSASASASASISVSVSNVVS
ncbi:MAG: hypothetical protein ACLU4K_02095, partial [Oscillospiraceae bacterium]